MNPPQPSGRDGEFAWHSEYEDEAAERAEQTTEHFAAIPSELWDELAPPAPDEQAWAAVRCGIADRLAARRAVRSRRGARLLIAAAALPLAVLAAWLAGTRDQPAVTAPKLTPTVAVAPLAEVDDPLAVYAVLPMAEVDEVAIESVRGDMPAGSLMAADAPPEELALAGPNDVILVSVRPAPGTTPIAKLSANPGDAPMIYAAKPSAR
jgi:hypothetical protein